MAPTLGENLTFSLCCLKARHSSHRCPSSGYSLLSSWLTDFFFVRAGNPNNDKLDSIRSWSGTLCSTQFGNGPDAEPTKPDLNVSGSHMERRSATEPVRCAFVKLSTVVVTHPIHFHCSLKMDETLDCTDTLSVWIWLREMLMKRLQCYRTTQEQWPKVRVYTTSLQMWWTAINTAGRSMISKRYLW